MLFLAAGSRVEGRNRDVRDVSRTCGIRVRGEGEG
jgi:hypothetical protein